MTPAGRPEKRSLTLRGHRTSVSLEAEFWAAFREIARARGVALNELAAQLDERRGEVGLASSIRVFVLREVQRQGSASSAPAAPSSGTGP